MNAMFLLCQCNSCLTKACGALAPVVQQTNEAGTNCSDVCIADVICRSTIIIVTILVAGFLAWKLIENNAKENERNFKKKKEEEESKRKQEADEKNRTWQLQDESRKHVVNLLNKKLEVLHELCYNPYNPNEKDSKKEIKEINSTEVYNYLLALDRDWTVAIAKANPIPEQTQTVTSETEQEITETNE